MRHKPMGSVSCASEILPRTVINFRVLNFVLEQGNNDIVVLPLKQHLGAKRDNLPAGKNG